jgi:hypothetical protein
MSAPKNIGAMLSGPVLGRLFVLAGAFGVGVDAAGCAAGDGAVVEVDDVTVTSSEAVSGAGVVLPGVVVSVVGLSLGVTATGRESPSEIAPNAQRATEKTPKNSRPTMTMPAIVSMIDLAREEVPAAAV